MIVLLLSKVVDLITAIVISFVEAVEAFEYSVAKQGIETQGSNVKREKVYCHGCKIFPDSGKFIIYGTGSGTWKTKTGNM